MALKSKYSPLTKPSFENIYYSFTSLTPRDQLIAMVIGGLLIILLVVVPLGMVSGKVSDLRTGISKSRAKLEDVIDKISEYRTVQDEIKVLERRFGRGLSSPTAVMGQVQEILEESKLAGSKKSLKVKTPVEGVRTTELPVRLELRNITTKNLVDFMYRIESFPSALMRIQRLEIKSVWKNRSYMNVSMEIANVKLLKED